MASLIDNLIYVLSEENEIYKKMIPLAEEKTKVIVANDLEALNEITAKEQELADHIVNLEKKRQEVIVNIGTVLNKKPDSLTIRGLIDILKNQPTEADKLRNLHDELRKTVMRMVDLNSRNKQLIDQSLEMIEFNMNYIQSAWMSPGTGQYGRTAAEIGTDGSLTGMFDAKQ